MCKKASKTGKQILFCTIVAAMAVIVICPSAMAAEGTGHTLSGIVLNRADKSPVEMATVRLFSYTQTSAGRDSVLVQGAQTDMDGAFILTNIRAGEYRLYISSVGFTEVSRTVKMPDNQLDLPAILLQEEVMHLAEVSVRGHAAEMTVKGDTIEYNTAAYQVGENAMVEDLLKKMNGVTVDKEGNVTVNGESVTAVRIDGKKFFGSDVQAGTKNIPAEMIEKVQVIDEKSDMAKLTGFEDDDSERIINLTLKKDRKKGVFGNYSGALGADMVTENGNWLNYGDPAYGTTAADRTKHFFQDDFRYNASLFTNILLGESQTTIIGGANNTNEIRSGRGRGPFSGQNAGITWSENLGVNTNIDLNSRITKRDATTSLLFGGDAALNHSYNDTRTQTNKESYTEDATYLNADSTSKISQSWDANVRLELEYQIDSANKLILQPRISYTNSRYTSYNAYTYDRGDERINDGYQNQTSLSEDISASIRAIYNHKFARPGRALTLNGNIDFTNTKGQTETFAWDNLLSRATVNQHTQSGNNALSYSLKTSYVEPVYRNNHLLEIAATFSGKDRDSHKDQYSMDSITGDYQFDSTYSNILSNHLYTEQLELNYRWVEQKFDLTLGARVLATQTHSTTSYGDILARDTLYNQWNWSPNIQFKYKFGKKEFARIMYRGTVSQPTITQMEPVRNNSDAMSETVGNLSLQPAFQHNLMVMYSRFNTDRMSGIMTGMRGTLTKDALVANSIYDETGKLYQQTVNADILPWNLGADFMYNTPFANKLMQFNTRTAVSYNQRVGYILREQSAADIGQMIDAGTMLRGETSRTGNLQVSEDMALRLTHSIVDVGLRGNITYSRTQNTLNINSLSNVLNWSVTGDLTLHLPHSWNIATDCGYTARYGYTGLTDINEIIWNASVDKSWQNATLTLKVYDLLHQKKNIVQTVGDNYVSYRKYNTLPTYFLLTFTYKLNRMGSLKAKGMGGHIQDMLESGQKPGTPPVGPPPGPPPGM